MIPKGEQLVINAPTPGYKAKLVYLGKNHYRIDLIKPKGIQMQVITPIKIDVKYK